MFIGGVHDVSPPSLDGDELRKFSSYRRRVSSLGQLLTINPKVDIVLAHKTVRD